MSPNHPDGSHGDDSQDLQALFQKRTDNFVPLPDPPEHHRIPVKTPPTGYDTLRPLAFRRIYLQHDCQWSQQFLLAESRPRSKR